MKVTKIRAGLYTVSTGHRNFTVENVGWMDYVSYNPWRVTDSEQFHDGWIGDFHTKSEALATIHQMTNTYATHN